MTASPFAMVMQASKWYAANPLSKWKPSPAFAPFMNDPARRILIRAANRVGKTEHVGARMATLMCKVPGKRYRVVGTDFKQTHQVAGGYLHRFIPPGMLTSASRYSEARGWNYDKIELTNGTTCEFRTYEQRPDQHAGGDMDGVWCDEPPPQLIWAECLRRVFSRQGFIWLSFTPLGRDVTDLRKVIEAEKSVWKQYLAEMSVENCPWYTAEQVEAWKQEVRDTMPDAYEQTINGAWEGITSDRVFTGYDSSSHFTPATAIPSGARWGVGVDHGEGAGKQVAILVAWVGEGKEARMWVLDECVSKGVTTPEQDAKAIREMLQRNGRDVADIYRWKGDINTAGKGAAGKSCNEMLALCLAEEAEYKRFPREFESADKGADSIMKGEGLINKGFLRDRILVNAPRCPVLCRSLAHYSGQEEYKHALDAFRYIAVPALDPGEELPTLGSVSLGFGF